MMNRREFLVLGGAACAGSMAIGGRGLGASLLAATGDEIAWHRAAGSRLFDQVACKGRPLARDKAAGLMSGFCAPLAEGKPGADVLVGGDRVEAARGPVRMTLAHRLHHSRDAGPEDLLEVTLTLTNASAQSRDVLAGFLCGACPCASATDQQVYVPFSCRGISKPVPQGEHSPHDCRQPVGAEGFLVHYLEAQASDPRGEAKRPLLLAPVVDVFAEGGPCRIALIGSSVEPVYFEALQGPSSGAWRMARQVRIEPGGTQTLRAFLLIHSGEADEAWAAFHRFGHEEAFGLVDWAGRIRVHYYDFLSAAEPDGPRGGGYDADLAHFAEFHVGMATQHGYYFALGDYLRPDRKEWQAMPTDPKGPATMSLAKLRERIKATRAAGARAMVYLHFNLFDEGTPLYEKLKDAIEVDAEGNPVPFGWQGPDCIGKTWKMSVAAPAWREHLVQQAQWVMELLEPDGIVLDETFAGWGYDYHPDRRGPTARHGIELMRKLREVVHAFGSDKALFASDCSMANYVLWADGEGGDHAYDRLLGLPLYRQRPVRYLAALGAKPWRPCAWCFQEQWPAQMDLARAIGAGVGVSNGWNEYTGLTRLPADVKRRMIRDIESLLKG
ncbi:MAG: hypothetical protein JW809_16270 [Pirellulales bacterium]|nr:hypothetical protein [Pirellulales bacterium]